MDQSTEEALSVREAAGKLGISERSVLNLLKKGALNGQKSGKCWRVSGCSVKRMSPTSRAPSRVSEGSGEAIRSEEHPRKRASKHAGLGSLRAFQICCEVLWEDPVAALMFGEFAKGTPECVRLCALRSNILEELGAGFVSYGVEKLQAYGRARASSGRLLAGLERLERDAAVELDASLKKQVSQWKQAYEERFLSAMSSLHRMISRREKRSPS